MISETRPARLDSILEKAEGGSPLSEGEIVVLLSIVQREEKEALFAAARRVRARQTGQSVFLYGFVYLSTYCRNDCHFCFYRKSNTDSLRYRKSPGQVLEAAALLAEQGVHLIDLTMGEDPVYFAENSFDEVAHLVASVGVTTGLPVMVSPGLVDRGVLASLKESGASWYACYQETFDRGLFKKIRPGQDFDRRLEAKGAARGMGLLTEEGILSGLGESPIDVARSLAAMREMEADQVRVMSFVPQKGTPLSDQAPGDIEAEVKILAVMRLLFPDRLIPASLDIGGLRGLKERLDAGANVVTSLVPPGEGLAGVAQTHLDIEDAGRTVSSVEPVLQECGLAAASREEYREWVEARMERIGRGGGSGPLGRG